jgi:hypothetical protein
MIEKFAIISCEVSSEYLDLNHTSKSMLSSVPLIPKLAPYPCSNLWRASESGH